MTERLRASTYSYYGEPKSSANDDLSPKKTILVLVVVVGCFAILWPKLFYPMLVANANNQIKPGPIDKTTGCCDVIYETDLDTIRIMSELCNSIFNSNSEPPSSQEIVSQCQKAVLETCDIDISAVLQEKVGLGHSVKQILDEVRSLNGSLCLKYNFGLSPWRLGVPHRVTVNMASSTIRQERPPHLRPEMVHPAFRERGRAIPQSETSVNRRTNPPPRIVEGRPGPIPGMRPTMGGAGHVIPSKQQNNGIMGLLMPIYTIGFVIFFTYTIMKLAFKKKPDAYQGETLYPSCEPDEDFRKQVFESAQNYYNQRSHANNSKIVVNAVSAILEEVDQEIQARKTKNKKTLNEQNEVKSNESTDTVQEEDRPSVTVMGMEITASCEDGKKWPTTTLPDQQVSARQEPVSTPQQIFLETALPPQSQILVADSATETQNNSDENAAIILAGKMTLSVISFDSENNEDSLSPKKEEEFDRERRTSSSNTSDEFEKVDASQLEEQIDNILEEAKAIAAIEKFDVSEEIDKINEEIKQNSEEIKDIRQEGVIEEIFKNELLDSLKDDEPKSFQLESNLLSESNGLINENIVDLREDFLDDQENENNSETTKKDELIIINEKNDSTEKDEESKPTDILVDTFDSKEQLTSVDQNSENNLESTLIREPESNEKQYVLEETEFREHDRSFISEPKTKEPKIDSNELNDRSESIPDIQNHNLEDTSFSSQLELINKELELLSEKFKHQTEDETDNTNILLIKSENGNPDSSIKPILSKANESSTKEVVDGLSQRACQEELVKKDFKNREEKSSNQEKSAQFHEAGDMPEEIPEELTSQKHDDQQTDPVESQERYREELDDDYDSEVENIIDDVEYLDESDGDAVDDEIRNLDVADDNSDRVPNGHLNGNKSETGEENEMDDQESESDEEDEEIEEIIEYVDNTDEEGEEIIEISNNGHRHNRQNETN